MRELAAPGMRLGVSLRCLPPREHLAWMPALGEAGITGVEVVPSRLWNDPGEGLRAGLVNQYRRHLARAGMGVIGLHGLLDDHPDLGILTDGEARDATARHLRHLSAVCRDLGGRTLILGRGRQRGALPERAAWQRAFDFLEALLPTLEQHGTVLCIEPLGPTEVDFLGDATACRILANALDHPHLGLQMNARGLVENGEVKHALFAAIYGRLEHFAANEPGLAVLGESGRVDHAALRRHLSASAYRGWITLEQAYVPGCPARLLAGVERLTTWYLRPDNLSLTRLRNQVQGEAATALPGLSLA